ncbi:hypothetical protein [Arthrobacter sp.]|uniref:hypothetical protein n=1 Tax=Arthrobacter sp. TaxID=1667 RepID=UPI0033962427
MSPDEYLNTLAYEMRQRKNSEETVLNTLQEVRTYLGESGESGEAAFGQPRDYAASFPAGKSVSRGTRIGHMAAGLVVLMLGTYLVLRGIVGISFGIPGTLTYFAVILVLTAVLVLTAKYVDRRLPDLR